MYHKKHVVELFVTTQNKVVVNKRLHKVNHVTFFALRCPHECIFCIAACFGGSLPDSAYSFTIFANFTPSFCVYVSDLGRWSTTSPNLPLPSTHFGSKCELIIDPPKYLIDSGMELRVFFCKAYPCSLWCAAGENKIEWFTVKCSLTA